MIIRKFPARDDFLRLGSSGEELCMRPEYRNMLFFALQPSHEPVPACLPCQRKKRQRVALIASSRVFNGFAWHNACYPLVPGFWRQTLRLSRPAYLLVESCLYDSARSWPLACFRANFTSRIREICNAARRLAIPAIFWYTLGPDLLPCFAEVMRSFDFVACADIQIMENLRKMGLEPRYFPWAFAPEQFNPLKNRGASCRRAGLLFDGISRLMRFSHIRYLLKKLDLPDLEIIESGMLVPEYNLQHFDTGEIAGKIAGCVSQTFIQDWYRQASALLSLPDSPRSLSPAQQWRALEAAACHLPVLHYGSQDTEFLKNFAELFSSADSLRERWETLRNNFMEREIAGHLAWRKSHSSFTFSQRMDELESWLGLDHPKELAASVVVPSIRPQYYESVAKWFRNQKYRNSELIYVFNGSGQVFNPPAEAGIRVLHVPAEYSSGMVINAGICAARGDCVFKCDDDDLYGLSYVADRMIYFREFPVDILCNARFFVNFADSGEAHLVGASDGGDDHTIFPMGHTSYSMYKANGGSLAMRREFAVNVKFQEQAYAHADVSLLMKGILFARRAIFLKVDCLNFCVRRGETALHTWAAASEEIMAHAVCSTPLEMLFV